MLPHTCLGSPYEVVSRFSHDLQVSHMLSPRFSLLIPPIGWVAILAANAPPVGPAFYLPATVNNSLQASVDMICPREIVLLSTYEKICFSLDDYLVRNQHGDRRRNPIAGRQGDTYTVEQGACDHEIGRHSGRDAHGDYP